MIPILAGTAIWFALTLRSPSPLVGDTRGLAEFWFGVGAIASGLCALSCLIHDAFQIVERLHHRRWRQ